MKGSKCLTGLLAYLYIHNAYAVDPTDTLMDADSEQSSYLPNHNMDPAVIQGGGFGQIWRYTAPAPANGQPEQFYSKPLVYTPSSTGRQIVLSFSEQNKIYALDAINGTLYASRDLSLEGEPPFLVSDIGCNDISGTIGITGTPVIDPTTDTVFFWAKSYNGAATGYQNGAYRFHGVDAATLKERPGFPINIQGQPADNDNTRIFTGGTVLQRASLNLVNGVVFAGFGGHCDQYNYTGWIVGMSTAGKHITSYATSGGLGAPPQDGTWNGGGGGSGVWMAGMPLASDNSGRLFFVTGNGYKGTDNQQQPASGRVHLDTLSECVVNMAVDPQTGVLTQQDYFEPYSYLAMDLGDRDLGSGGICLPDPATFSGTGVARMAITCGKNGQCYVVNRDNLGGYKLGPSGGDAIIQTLSPPSGGSIFANGGTYPLEGGYFYVTPVGSPTYVYSLGFSNTGVPVFTLAAATAESASGRVGVGPPTITTYKGQPGTGIVWFVDPDAGIRAYNAVPVNGNMTRIPLPASPSVSKYQRPAFGNGRYYLSTADGQVLAYGSPVALPLICNALNFGAVLIGNSMTMNITCVANIPITSLVGIMLGKSIFQATNSSLPTGALMAGASFSFPVIFNLTGYVLSAGSTSAPIVSPGVQSTSINILTKNGQTGFASETSISLTGKSVSPSPFISMNPLQVDFSGIVIGSAAAAAGSANTFVINNIGQNSMTILGYAWTTSALSPDSGTPTTYNNVTATKDSNGNKLYVLDGSGFFTSANLPAVGTIIAGGGSITVNALFNTTDTGDYFTTLIVYSDGGSAYTILTGAASTAPVAVLQYSTNEGGWATIPDCPVPANGCTSTIDLGTSPGLTITSVMIRFSNNGGSALTVTKSKPPEGTVLFANNPTTDLSEGLAITPGDSSSATISFEPPESVLNADDIVYSGTWTLNTNDLTFGVHILNFTGTIRSVKTGPQTATGQGLYRFLGCYQDLVNGVRIESQNSYVNANNTNGLCQTQAQSVGAVFAGTEYMQQCWVGSAIPSASQLALPTACNYQCAGDPTQTCGGNGGFISIYYDSSRYFPSNGTIIPTKALALPPVGGYNYSGCWTDNQNARALSALSTASQTSTLESCAAFCSKYSIFGTEYGTECYCGNILASSSTLRPDSECSMNCAGNTTEFCGAGSRLSVYTNNVTILVSAMPSSVTASSSSSSSSSASPTSTPVSISAVVGAYSYVGCETDLVYQRTLQGLATSAGTMNVEQCAAFCSSYTYFGVEYSRECYCGNALTAGSTIATDGRCSMTCAGNGAEMCGGPNGLSLYQLTTPLSNSASIPSVTSISSTSTSGTSTSGTSTSGTSTSSTTSPSTASQNIPATIGSYSYIECHSDNTTIRTLQSKFVGSSSMTIETCAATCTGYTYFGVEYGGECYCGNVLTAGSYRATDGRCNMKCSGNTGEICGGPNGLTLFAVMLGGQLSPSSASSLAPTPATLIISATTASSTTSVTSTSGPSSSSSSPASSSSPKSTSPSSSTSSITSSLSSSCTSTDTIVITATVSSSSISSSIAPSPSLTSGSITLSPSMTISGSSALRPIGSGYSTSTLSAPTSTPSTISGSSSSSTYSTSLASSSTDTSFASISTSSSISSPLSFGSTTSTTSTTSLFSSGLSSLSTLRSTGSTTLLTSTSTSITSSRSTLISTASGSSTSSTSGNNLPSSSSLSPTLSPTTSSNSWTNLGCANDTTSTRALSGLMTSNSTSMTIEMCQSFCIANNLPLAGLEYSSECYCGLSLGFNSSVGKTGCSMACSGNAAEICGGSSRLSVYKYNNFVAPSIISNIGTYSLKGCYTDSTSTRGLSAYMFTNSTGMTEELCVTTCQGRGYSMAGIEYGQECYCDNVLARSSTVAPGGIADCQAMYCPGNKKEYCSAGNRLLIYSGSA